MSLSIRNMMGDVVGQGQAGSTRVRPDGVEKAGTAEGLSLGASAPMDRQGALYPDPQVMSRCVRMLESRDGIVSESDIERLSEGIARAQTREAFVLHAGDCAEGFASAERRSVESRLTVLWQMGVLLERFLGVPVIRVGRMAGQYAKPRSDEFEFVQGGRLPVFRGELINGAEPTPWEREHRPERLLWGYRAALHTVHLMDDALALGTISTSLKADCRAARAAVEHPRFAEISAYLARAQGLGPGAEVGREFFVSHEALLLPYEKALTRAVPGCARSFNMGAHLLWLGERTRQLDGPHALYLASIANPIGLKLGPSATTQEVCSLVRMLNPGARPGRLILIPRLGVGAVHRVLPEWIEAVRDTGIPVLWSCDPMHGNTFKTGARVKARRVEDVVAELTESLLVHEQSGSFLGGIHLEVAGDDITECLGGMIGIREEELGERYETLCDPRLSHAQALEVAWAFAEHRSALSEQMP